MPIPGLLVAGNVDLAHRPRVPNLDGSVSTVQSMSVNIDGREVLIPRVLPDGRMLSPADAIRHYEKTGQHLGIFDTPEHATAYAQQLHEDQAADLAGPAWPGPKLDALAQGLRAVAGHAAKQ